MEIKRQYIVKKITLFTQRALKIDCPVRCIVWPRLLSRYTPQYDALQASFEFYFVTGLAKLTLQTTKLGEDAESNLFGFH